jgi:CBS domain-containing protein
MNKFRIGSVIVVNNGRPVGIITERNILARIVEPRRNASMVKAKDIMSSPLIKVEPHTAVDEAAKLMATKNIKTLPVVDGEMIEGIVTSSDIVRESPTQLRILEELLRVS